MNGALPLATTLSAAVPPLVMVCEAGWVVMPVALQTVTVAVLLFAVAVPLQVLVTRTQYDFVAVSAGVVKDALLVPTGVVVVPLAPSYHC